MTNRQSKRERYLDGVRKRFGTKVADKCKILLDDIDFDSMSITQAALKMVAPQRMMRAEKAFSVQSSTR